MQALADAGVRLNICPTSNLHTHAVKDLQELAHILGTFSDRKIKFTINTDGPYLLRTNMRTEVELLLNNKVLSAEQIRLAVETARKSTFIA